MASARLLQLCLALALALLGNQVFFKGPGPVGYRVGAAILGLTLVVGLLLTVLRPTQLLPPLERLAAHRAAGWATAGALALTLPLVFSPHWILLSFTAACLAVWVAWRRGLYPKTEPQVRAAWLTVLACALGVRLVFTIAVPWPLWSWDSGTYLLGAHTWVSGAGQLSFHPARTPGFGLYALAILAPFKSYLLYLLVTHGLGVGVAWWAGRVLRRHYGELAGWLAFAVLALSPQQIFHEHMLLTEAPFWILLTAIAVLLVQQLRDDAAPKRPVVAAAVLGLATAAAVLLRPAAVPLPLLIGAGALLARWSKPRLLALAAAMLLPLLAWIVPNGGLTNMGGITFFGVAGHHLDLDSQGHEAIKREMQRGVERHNEDHPWWNPDFNFLVNSRAGPVHTSRSLQALGPFERDRVLKELGVQAIRQHPLRFAGRSAFQLWLWQVSSTGFYHPHWEGLQDHDLIHHELEPPEARRLLLSRERAAPGLYQYGVVYPSWALGLLPFQVFEQPLLILLLLGAWRRAPRDRTLLLVLAALAAALVGLTCALGVGWLARYHMQAVPLVAVGFAIVAHGWRAAEHPAATPENSSPPSPWREVPCRT